MRTSSLSIPTFLLILRGEGLANQPVRFALDEDGGVLLRAVDTEEDVAWSLALDQRVDWSREMNAVIDLWVVNRDTQWLSELFIQLMGVGVLSFSSTDCGGSVCEWE